MITYNKKFIRMGSRFKVDARCIYFLMRRGDIVYVGQTKNLGIRIINHKADKEFDEVFFIEAPSGCDVDSMESAFIAYFNPYYNVVKHHCRVCAWKWLRGQNIPVGQPNEPCCCAYIPIRGRAHNMQAKHIPHLREVVEP